MQIGTILGMNLFHRLRTVENSFALYVNAFVIRDDAGGGGGQSNLLKRVQLEEVLAFTHS